MGVVHAPMFMGKPLMREHIMGAAQDENIPMAMPVGSQTWRQVPMPAGPTHTWPRGQPLSELHAAPGIAPAIGATHWVVPSAPIGTHELVAVMQFC